MLYNTGICHKCNNENQPNIECRELTDDKLKSDTSYNENVSLCWRQWDLRTEILLQQMKTFAAAVISPFVVRRVADDAYRCAFP